MNNETFTFGSVSASELKAFKDVTGFTPPIFVYPLRRGDEFYVNANGVYKTFGIKIKNIKLSSPQVAPGVICIEKIKRKWWQVWKPKYVAGRFMCVESREG